MLSSDYPRSLDHDFFPSTFCLSVSRGFWWRRVNWAYNILVYMRACVWCPDLGAMNETPTLSGVGLIHMYSSCPIHSFTHSTKAVQHKCSCMLLTKVCSQFKSRHKTYLFLSRVYLSIKALTQLCIPPCSWTFNTYKNARLLGTSRKRRCYVLWSHVEGIRN